MKKEKNKILIIGSQGHAKVIIDLIQLSELYEIVGLIDDFRSKGEIVENYHILGGIEDIPRLQTELRFSSGVIAIGDNWVRNKVYLNIMNLASNFNFISLVHPKASVAGNVVIEEGSVVMAGAVINSSARIGKHCIINTRSSVDHDSVLEDFSSIAPGVTLGGWTKIKSYSAIGIGTTIKDRITIGEHTIIGAGSLVLKDIKNLTIAYGSPCKSIRDREIGEKYL
jgi:sugar O-acyltransferase (sialic acid O-acetyltransferase NeuD family)